MAGQDLTGQITLRHLLNDASALPDGRLFDPALLADLPDWRRIFVPLQAATGMLRFRLPRLFSPVRAPPDLVGHSGIPGAFAFRDRASGIIASGTTNQFADRGAPCRLMIKALAVADRHGWTGVASYGNGPAILAGPFMPIRTPGVRRPAARPCRCLS